MNRLEKFYKRTQRITDDYIAMSRELEETSMAYKDMALTMRRLNKTLPAKKDKQMVERVAKALFYLKWVRIKWEDNEKFVRDCRKEARAWARKVINAAMDLR